MSRSGSETRRRTKKLGARFTPEEALLIKAIADRRGTSIAALIRFLLLDEELPRASRQPSVSHTQAAQLLGQLGFIASGIRNAELTSNEPLLIDALHRDIAEMRSLLFEALGRQP